MVYYLRFIQTLLTWDTDQQDSAEGLLQADPDVPDLPDEPISFEDWDADGDFDYEEWDEGKDYSTTLSNNESTTTLSSKSSKRTFEEVENSENYGEWAPASSPGQEHHFFRIITRVD